MTFMVLTMEKSYLVTQKTQLEYQQLVATNNYNYVTSQLTALASNEKTDTESNAFKQLEYQQETFNTQKESIDSQLRVINAEVDNYQKAIDANIKSECKLNISG